MLASTTLLEFLGMISLCCSFYLLGLTASVQSSEQVRGDLPVLDTQQLMLIPAKHGVHLAGGEGVGEG